MRPLSRRAELLDAEAQQADHNRAMRDERRGADRYDRATYVNINGSLYDLDDVPHPADVADLDEWGRR